MANRYIQIRCFESNLNSNYNLCRFCAIRNGILETKTKESQSIKKIIINKKLNGLGICFICRGLFEIIDEITQKIIFFTTAQNKYEFSSYYIGSSVPTFLFENEDHIRSVFKIRGMENIKSAFNKEVRNKSRKILKKSLKPVQPDLMITLSVKDDFDISIAAKSRSYYLIGRYTKKKIMFQKNLELIEFMSKTGNKHLNFNYNASVETRIKKKLIELTISKNIKINWMGSEDPNSLVLGKGRFFIAEVIEPQKRRISKNLIFHEDGLNFRIEAKKEFLAESNIKYISKIRAYVKTMNPIDSKKYLKLKQLKNTFVTYKIKSKIIQKKLYNISAKKLDTYHFVVTFLADSGLFIKQFIEKKIDITPSVSSQMENDCICLKFDIIGIYKKH